MTHRAQVEAILAGARAERNALLDQLSPALRASLPVDATGITQALDYLGEQAGLDLHEEQLNAHKTNAAVLHGRVFGRQPLSKDTVHAAFLDGARVRAQTLNHLAQTVACELELTEPDDDLQAAYAAQEQAAIQIATHLDDHNR